MRFDQLKEGSRIVENIELYKRELTAAKSRVEIYAYERSRGASRVIHLSSEAQKRIQELVLEDLELSIKILEEKFEEL